ncbi:MAG: hypothetical protein JST76_13080 [Bacteroidetes bacterium]|nr:hypothetical protein [Bacteroidota bacterium]
MKRLFFLGLLLCMVSVAFAQTGQRSILFRDHHQPVMALTTPAPLSMVQWADSGAHQASYNSSEYKFGRRQRNGGIALTVIGAVLAAGGSALLAVGVPALKRDIGGENTPVGDYVEHGGEVGGGGLALLVGTPLLISGIVKIVKGSKAMKRAAPGY